MFVYLSLYWHLVTATCEQEAVKSPGPALRGRKKKKKPDLTLCTCDVSMRALATATEVCSDLRKQNRKKSRSARCQFFFFCCSSANAEVRAAVVKIFSPWSGRFFFKGGKIREKKKFHMCYSFQERCCISRFSLASAKRVHPSRKCVSR